MAGTTIRRGAQVEITTAKTALGHYTAWTMAAKGLVGHRGEVVRARRDGTCMVRVVGRPRAVRVPLQNLRKVAV